MSFDATTAPAAGNPVADSAPAAPAAVPGGGGAASATAAAQQVQRFNFRQPSLLTTSQLRSLRLRHEGYTRALATRLSIHLRLEAGVTLASFDVVTCGKLLAGLPSPTHLTTFKFVNRAGLGLLEMPVNLGIALVDRLLGGPGQPIPLERGLTEIEVALLDEAVAVMVKEWAQTAGGLAEINLEIAAHETQPRFAQVAEADAPMLAVVVQIALGDCSGAVHLAFPLSWLDTVLRQLAQPLEAKPPAPTPAKPDLRWNPLLADLHVPVSAAWAGIEVSARDLAQLRVGDVLPVTPAQLSQTQVRIAQVTKFIGRLGRCGPSWAIEISEPFKP